jgi:hypothetical protein
MGNMSWRRGVLDRPFPRSIVYLAVIREGRVFCACRGARAVQAVVPVIARPLGVRVDGSTVGGGLGGKDEGVWQSAVSLVAGAHYRSAVG